MTVEAKSASIMKIVRYHIVIVGLVDRKALLFFPLDQWFLFSFPLGTNCLYLESSLYFGEINCE